MTTRGATRRTRATLQVDARRFAWSRWTIATLSHTTLPWGERFAALPLSEAAQSLGERDRISLLAQFAAHQAFLRFAGLADGSFDGGEWAAVTHRGCDVRLVRIAAAASDAVQAPPVVVSARAAAEVLQVSLDILAQPLARADHIYGEAIERLCTDISADLRWSRRAAFGAIDSPGPELLATLTERPASYRCSDSSCLATLRRLQSLDSGYRVDVVSGVSPIEPLSALRKLLGERSLTDAAAAELLVGSRSDRTVTVVDNEEAVDAASWRVIDIASAAGHGVWISSRGATPLPLRRWFLAAPDLAARSTVEARLSAVADAEGWLEELVFSPSFPSYIRTGELPPARGRALENVGEPQRSFLGALALIGPRMPRDVASCFLQHFAFSGPLEDLSVPGVAELQDGSFVFADEDARRQAMRVIPPASRAAICRVAATLTKGVTSALLWHEGGDAARASAILESTDWPSADATVEALSHVPHSVLTPKAAARFAAALNDCGRYRDARAIAALAGPVERELLFAVAERRTGDYLSAIDRLVRMPTRAFHAQLLLAELLRLTGRCEEAASELARCHPGTEEESIRHAYELAVLAIERGMEPDGACTGEHYLAHRLAAYRALSSADYGSAAAHAEAAFRAARTTAERIDAALDRLYSSFAAGEWDAARAIGIEALQEVEDTQGDRAAGGILFTLAYLAADNGQWEYAANRIEVLRRYYGGVRDARRETELRLLTAQLEFGRGHFDAAAAAASELLDKRPAHDQIGEAAALILDEIDWIEHRATELRSRGGAGNAELARRHQRLRTLRAGGTIERCAPLRTCDRLELFREAVQAGDVPTASGLAAALNLAFDASATPAASELEILRAVATREFPFNARDLPRDWCFSTRNRLGQWSTVGPARADASVLEAVFSTGAADWMRCSDRELLFVAGSSRWTRDTRDALAALFRIRSENERMHRILAEEGHAAPRTPGTAPEGMVGESRAMRALYELIAKVAARDVQVCVLGESGTGKELVARAIHRQSLRRQKPFVTLNCAALPENLVESELFGHVRGAFTGADRDRPGLLEAGDGGTLFLDEIGELPLTAQAKLLRFLQDGEYRRVGDTAVRSADVRLVSATNRPLETRVEEGLFRDDLYYRIRGIEIHLPPLRERGADVALLASHFVTIERQRHRGGPLRLSEEAEAAIAAYPWPGNVRELQHAIRAAHALAGDVRQIDLEHLPDRLRSALRESVPAGSYQDAVTRFKRDLIERSLTEAAGNQNRAAAMLRISRQALAYQIRELGILVGRSPGRQV